MDKAQFMELLGKAYGFPDYYALNLDSADEVIEDLKEEVDKEKLSLKNFFDALLAQESDEERLKIWAFLTDHFAME